MPYNNQTPRPQSRVPFDSGAEGFLRARGVRLDLIDDVRLLVNCRAGMGLPTTRISPARKAGGKNFNMKEFFSRVYLNVLVFALGSAPFFTGTVGAVFGGIAAGASPPPRKS